MLLTRPIVLLLAATTLLPSLVAQDVPDTVQRAGSGPSGLLQIRSRHLVWGTPVQTDNRHNIVYPGETQVRPGLSILVREGFVVGHYDRLKVPAWVAVRWTREDYERMVDGRYGRPFDEDEDLPRYARAGISYDYSTSKMERGHMARHEDNEAWGEDNSRAGCLMSNVVPQHKDMNGEAWNDLEELHQDVVVDASIGITAVWVISGPMFKDMNSDGEEEPESFVGNQVAVPYATYKVIGWFDDSDQFQARGYVVKQTDRVRNNPAHYLRPIDEIEAATGLNFFPGLEAARQAALESATFTSTWGSSTGGSSGPATLRIVAATPNPVGSDDANESVTIRNDGDRSVDVTGWQLRDAARRTWILTGRIEAGDERRFVRNGQQMALNNDGDTVELLRPTGERVDRVTYSSSQVGVAIRFGG